MGGNVLPSVYIFYFAVAFHRKKAWALAAGWNTRRRITVRVRICSGELEIYMDIAIKGLCSGGKSIYKLLLRTINGELGVAPELM